MKKIIKTLVFISSLAFGHQVFAAACSDEPITDTSTCHAIPDTYTITLYEMGLCNDISEQSSTVPDIVTSCQTAFLNSAGSTVNVENNVTGSLSGGTSTRPDDNTYAYGFIKVDAKMIMKNHSIFSVARNDFNGGAGTSCWTNGNPFGGITTTCGNEVDANPQNMDAEIVFLDGAGGGTDYYGRYESDPEGLDNTYAWLVDANGNASTSPNYSEDAGDVKYLIGIAKFNEPKTVNNASTGMQAQFVVTRALSVGFSDGNRVNYGLNEFKVLTEITTD